MDLIERRKAIYALQTFEKKVETAQQVWTIRGCEEVIYDIPSEDLDIVHCKECRYCKQNIVLQS